MKVIAALLPLGLSFTAAVVPALLRHEEAGTRQIGSAVAAEPKEIIGIQVRKQGFACDRPMSAEPEPSALDTEQRRVGAEMREGNLSGASNPKEAGGR